MIVNAWGQELKVNTFVYRGARLGNSSEFKAGVIESIKDGKPRVLWMYRGSTRWININSNKVSVPFVYEIERSNGGSPSVESLIVPDFNIEYIQHLVKVHKNFPKDANFVSLEEYYHFLRNFQI